jgi:hypothetical protein
MEALSSRSPSLLHLGAIEKELEVMQYKYSSRVSPFETFARRNKHLQDEVHVTASPINERFCKNTTDGSPRSPAWPFGPICCLA